MSDKSQLEKDIERRELVKIPFSVLVLIALLSVALGSLGVYTFKLKQDIGIRELEIRSRDQVITSIKRNLDNEKSEFLAIIKALETGKERVKADPESMSGGPDTAPSVSAPEKGRKDSAK
ncbi:hypothetical protein BMS3Abin10_01271 [bacterium BMS3Abin10]|nr:hypothetical protein BMS3Abin10_01271 [bacterium BMS3Abin10]GBE37929.1 hypothetical protein BMS3Bbin08_00528 [bacterium BMS3Bbin08]